MISRGSIYFVDLTPKSREQAGSRPVLVVSSDAINRQPLVVTVVVGTDAKHVRRDYPVNVRVSAAETGLPLTRFSSAFKSVLSIPLDFLRRRRELCRQHAWPISRMPCVSFSTYDTESEYQVVASRPEAERFLYLPRLIEAAWAEAQGAGRTD